MPLPTSRITRPSFQYDSVASPSRTSMSCSVRPASGRSTCQRATCLGWYGSRMSMTRMEPPLGAREPLQGQPADDRDLARNVAGSDLDEPLSRARAEGCDHPVGAGLVGHKYAGPVDRGGALPDGRDGPLGSGVSDGAPRGIGREE